MPDNALVLAPNIFDFATSELSQDAFICWLASWANPALRAQNEPLHATATDFLARLLEMGKLPVSAPYRSIEVRRQWKDIDVLLVVNGDTAIIIEDKTDTKDHSGQLDRYKKAVVGEFQENKIVGVYLKTGDQGNYRSVEEAGYGCFLRRDILAVLDRGERAGVRNDIFAEFHKRLRRIEEAVQSYQSVPLAEWDQDSNRWAGFFLALQQRLGEGDWKYVPNQRGGFMGFWWHWRGDKYLQLERAKLCFKINVADKAHQTAKWLAWNQDLIRLNGTSGVKVKKTRRKEGDCMTVAVLAADYRQADAQGRLDFEKTVQVLRDAEGFMDAALETQGRGEDHSTPPVVAVRVAERV